MSDLPTGYRWANEAESELNLPGTVLVKRTVDADGEPYTQDEADLAVPNSWPVVLRLKKGLPDYTCTDEFDEHGNDHATCEQFIYEMVNAGYASEVDTYDQEYQNYMYGSSRY